MTSRERTAVALARRVPDRVPYSKLWMVPEVAARLLALPREAIADRLTPQQAYRLASYVNTENILAMSRAVRELGNCPITENQR